MDELLGLNYADELEERKKRTEALLNSIANSMPQQSPTPEPILARQAPQPEPIPSATPERKPAAQKKPGAMDVNNFLKIIGQIESSSGRNFGHEEIQHGMHKGHRAIGTYGLMPNTIDDIIDNIKNAPEHIKAIKNMSPEQKKQFLESNPQYEEYFAKHLANRVVQRFKSPEKAAHAWHYGQYLNPNKLDKKRLQNEYVDKFRKIRQGLAKKGSTP